MDEFRDRELGEQLELLTEPDHGPDYWDQMRAQVAEVAAVRQPGPSAARRLRVALHSRRLRVVLACAALAAAAAATILIGLPRSRGPETVSAATVLRRALSANSSGRTWQADAVIRVANWHLSTLGVHFEVTQYHMMQSTDGSYRLTQIGATHPDGSAATSRKVTDDIAYDASTGILRRLRPGRPLVVVRGTGLGPPDRWPSPLTGVDFGAALRALQASGVLKLDRTVIDGRAAWTVTTTQGAPVDSPSGSSQGIDWPVYKITVDTRTWLPVRFQEVHAGALEAELRISNVLVDEPLPRDAFTMRPPKGLGINHRDGGFRRVTLAEASTVAGVTPLAPGFVPSGYKPAYAAVAARPLTVNGVVRARDVFELQYMRGFDALTVSTRRIAADPPYSGSDDPVDSYDPIFSDLVRVEAPITHGAFAGVTASIVLATTSSTPHLWAVKDGILLTIAGGADARELLEIADKLQRLPAPTAPD